MSAVNYFFGAVAAVIAIFGGLLMTVDLSSTTSQRPATALGSGAMFDAIASNYDRTNKVISLGSDVGWRKELVGSLRLERLPQGATILDLATGTAEVALALAGHSATPNVVGVDPSANMLSYGREKVTAAGLDDKISLHQGDAQNLVGYETDTYDGATMSFGIRNVPDRVAALKE